MAYLQVGDWEVDPALNEVRRGGEAVRLEPKAIEVLRYLAERPGQVVGREALLSAIWPGVVVGDDALTQAIIKLRRALGDDAHSPRYIETISKRGYRLIAGVIPSQGALPAASASRGASFRSRKKLAIAAAVILAVVAALALVAGLSGRWPIAPDGRSSLTASSPPTIAVLPLSNLSGDVRRDYFSDGLTEDLINALGRFSALRVLSRNAVEPFRTRVVTPQAVGRELGARYVLKGSVREGGGRLRVVVELSDAAKGTVLWSDRYEGEGRDVFDIQDRIVTQIAGTLAVKVTQLERDRISKMPVQNLEAHDLVLRARSLFHLVTRETNRQARELLARAVKLEPEYAEAFVALAQAEYLRGDQGWVEDVEASLRRAEDYARRALNLPDAGAHARAHALLAKALAHRWKLDEALAEADRAVALNPSDANALNSRGAILVWMGRAEEGTAVLEASHRFDPSLDNAMLPMGYYLLRRYRDAVAAADARIARSPEVVFVRAVRVAALGQLGEIEEAARAVEELRRRAPFARAENFGLNLRKPEDVARLHEGLRKGGL
jgi:TolB-like protein/DNA-binding winged helix-turn-helix (wHTH) protein/Flp pilus assembly protein TadD